MNRSEYETAYAVGDGYCTKCTAIRRLPAVVDPRSTELHGPCPVCGKNTVIGIAHALMDPRVLSLTELK